MIPAKELLKSHNKFHITLGLDRIKKIMDLLSNPQDTYKIIHIAGTNGKGSTSKLINDFLIENFKDKNVKVGLFTSPHLFSYTERIKINNENISECLFNILINRIDELAKSNNIELSEFELITAVAFYYFYIRQVDYVVLEVGLGGLLDSTNIIKNPLVNIITTIDFDHIERLGSNIEEIAIQKAGIIKEGSFVVVSPQNKGYETILKVINEKNAKLVTLKNISVKFNKEKFKNIATIDNVEYDFNLLGLHQEENLTLALSAVSSFCKIKKETLKKVLNEINWKFRLDYNKEENLLIDAGHNLQGIKSLCKFVFENFKNTQKSFIFGCLKNKNYPEMLNEIIKNKSKNDKIYFYSFNYPNALEYEELPLNIKENVIKIEKEELNKILSQKELFKIACGSIYMLGEIFNN